MAECVLRVDHCTIQRWVTRYLPAPDTEFRSRKLTSGNNWRVDETYILTDKRDTAAA